MADNVKFDNPQQEIEHWKQLYQSKCKELEDLEGEFNEFQETSRDMEQEMEKELQSTENKLKEMKSQFLRLKEEYDEAKDKTRRGTEESGKMIHALQEEAESLRKQNTMLKKEKRTLEQENDNLERRVRESDASLEDLTEKMNKTLEENAWLQTELEEKQYRNQETIQRMKDELRDLRLELQLSGAPVSNGMALKENKVRQDNNASTLPDVTNHTQEGVMVGSPPAMNHFLKPNGFKAGSVSLVEDMISLVRDLEQRLLLNKLDALSSMGDTWLSPGEEGQGGR